MGAKTILPWFGKKETKIKAEIETLDIKKAKKEKELSELYAKAQTKSKENEKA